MKHLLITLILLGLFFSVSESQKRPHHRLHSGVEGQVYRLGGPAQRIGWTPPPFQVITPITILDSTGKVLKEITTDSLGKFKIYLPPGKYSFVVKKSFIPTPHEVIQVTRNSIQTVKLFFDSGVR